MRDPLNWSLNLGKWWGLTIRIHASFLLFAGATLYLSWPPSGFRAAGDMFPVVGTGFLVLFGSVLWHELAHLRVARRFQLSTPDIILGPLGGLTDWNQTDNPAAAWRLAAAGPMANLTFVLAGFVALRWTEGQLEILHLINPLSPSLVADQPTDLAQILRVGIWINGLLAVVNLLPAFPFDGGRLMAAVMQCVRPKMPRSRIAEVVFWTAILTAATLLFLALVLWKHTADAPLPTWFALVLLAVVLLVSARRDILQDVGSLTSDSLPQRNWDAEPRRRSLTATRPNQVNSPQWLDQPEPIESTWTAHSAADDEQQLDEVLQRLHQGGMRSLDARDRELLQRVSARYRARRPH
jgi:stage IV sporulation protein FB